MAIRWPCATSLRRPKSSGTRTCLVYDHVLGAVHEGRDPELWGPYTEIDPFHEPFVLLGYIAAITTSHRARRPVS